MNTQPPDRRPPLAGSLRTDPGRLQAVTLVIVAFAVVLFLLVQARFIMISLAVAIILVSLMSDAIEAIARLRLGPLRVPAWAATLAALALVSGLLLTASAVILSQVNTVVATAIAYADQALPAVAGLFGWMGEGVEAAVLTSVRTIDISAYLRSAAAQAGNLLSATVLVILFVGFLFAERVWVPAKLRGLFQDVDRADRAGRVIGTIMHRVNRYLLVKTVVSAVTGLLVYGVARLFALDLAVAIGLLTFILNYIPSIGSIVATVLVGLVAFVQTGDPATAAAVFFFCGAIQFLLGNVIDPMLMGRALRLSSFGIIMSLAFWGAVWGVPGMFLAVPIMVAVMIVCSEVPALRPVAVLLSREGLPEPPHPLGD